MKEKYVVKNLFVHKNRERVINKTYLTGMSLYQYTDERDIFVKMLKNVAIEARYWLNKNSIYTTYEVADLNNHIRLWNSVYLLKDDCKINRRKIHIRPLDEEKYSTQLEDSKVYWSELWKEA